MISIQFHFNASSDFLTSTRGNPINKFLDIKTQAMYRSDS